MTYPRDVVVPREHICEGARHPGKVESGAEGKGRRREATAGGRKRKKMMGVNGEK
ncbi:hypothetical protein SESBI_18804 [Sesbania bispinosa]|nr:hypothetical protein SESBI_18804 [Sesbania bispinosa]